MQQTISQEGVYHARVSASDGKNSSRHFGLDLGAKGQNKKKRWEILQVFFTTDLNLFFPRRVLDGKKRVKVHTQKTGIMSPAHSTPQCQSKEANDVSSASSPSSSTSLLSSGQELAAFLGTAALDLAPFELEGRRKATCEQKEREVPAAVTVCPVRTGAVPPYS